MNCRNIIHTHLVLVRLLTETGLQYSTLRYQIEEANFTLFRKISTNATVKFGNRCFFKEMGFYGHDFEAVSDSCFRVTVISGS